MVAIIVFVLGIAIGSFLNVCIYRIPKKESIMFGRSYCPHCKKDVKWYDLIPLISYINLKGKCRFCKNPISLRYFIVELLNGVMWTIFYLLFGLTLIFALFSILSSIIIVLFYIFLNTNKGMDG